MVDPSPPAASLSPDARSWPAGPLSPGASPSPYAPPAADAPSLPSSTSPPPTPSSPPPTPSSPPSPPSAPSAAPGSTGWLRLFAWDERPEVEVRHDDGLWYRGRLRAWRRDDATGWRAMVTYHVAIGRQHYREVPADAVRRAAAREVQAPSTPAGA